MLESSLWIVAYSVLKKDFLIQQLGQTLEENRIGCLQGTVKDYQLIGIFFDEQTAQIFKEGFQSRLSLQASPTLAVSFPHELQAKQTLTYKEALAFINEQIDSKPYGFTKQLCKESNLTYTTVIGLTNEKLNFPAIDLVMHLLIALGYNVTMNRVSVGLARKVKDYQEETLYYIHK